MIIHYNCTIGSILLHSFLLIYHPYPPSFHEMIFTLVYIQLQIEDAPDVYILACHSSAVTQCAVEDEKLMVYHT